MTLLTNAYDTWLVEVRKTLDSINMPMEDWQAVSPFDFKREYVAGVSADDAALTANKFWWQQQNRRIDQDCRRTPNCWLPRNHSIECEPV
jgi:hypothetical protein